MKALARIAAAMSALGISTHNAMSLFSRRTVSKHAFNKSSRAAGKRSRCRLQIARGPGSISAKADIFQLAHQGKWLEAAAMADAHERMCGETVVSPTVREVWRSYAAEEIMRQV